MIKNADLGFHQYSVARPSAIIDKATLLDLFDGQQEDAIFFQKRGVSREFTDKMYDADPENMWYPSLQELKQNGLVHEIL